MIITNKGKTSYTSFLLFVSGFAVLLLGIVATVILANQNQTNPIKAANAFSVVVTPRIIPQKSSYRLELMGMTSPYTGPVLIQAWNCDSHKISICTTPTVIAVWKDERGNPYQFQNNTLTINLADKILPERLYFANLYLPSGASIGMFSVQVSRFATSGKVSQQQISERIVTAMGQIVSTIPSAKTVNGKTHNELIGNGADSLAKANNVILNICGAYPLWSSTTNLEQKAAWHGCAAAYAYILMLYNSWISNAEFTTTYAYVLSNQMDVLSTPSTNRTATEFGSSNPNHTLSGTGFAKSYINDFGMGVLSGYGWLNTKGQIDTTFCTSAETPYDSGKSCKNIQLKQRIAAVSRNVVTSTAEYRSFRVDPPFLSRSAVGRAVAGKISGSSGLNLPQLITDASKYVSSQFCSHTSSGYTGCLSGLEKSSLFYLNSGDSYPIVTSDNFQHLQTLLNVNNWTVSNEFKAKALVWSSNFFDTYFSTETPFVKLITDPLSTNITEIIPNYDETNIIRKFGPSAIGAVGTTAHTMFKRTSRGTLSGLRGEAVQDAILTSAPGLEILLRGSGYSQMADEVLAIMDKITKNFSDYTTYWTDELSDPSPVLGTTPKSELSIKLRRFAFLYYALSGLQRTPLTSITTTTPTPTRIPTLTPTPNPCSSSVNKPLNCPCNVNLQCASFTCSSNKCVPKPNTPTPTRIPTITPTKANTPTPTRIPTLTLTKTPTPTSSPSLCTQCPGKPQAKSKGDADCSIATNINDASIWRSEFIVGEFGSTVKNTWSADFDCDGKVTLNDASIWRSNFIISL